MSTTLVPESVSSITAGESAPAPVMVTELFGQGVVDSA
jgi:hypothetical protein